MDEHQDMTPSLLAAKIRRAQATTAEATKQTLAASIAAELSACWTKVTTAAQERADAVAAAKPDAVIDANAKLLHAKIAAEIVESRAATIRVECEAAVVACNAADAAVTAIACEIRMAEVVAKLERFERMLDEALRIGFEVQRFIGSEINRPLNQSLRVMPDSVTRALSRLPLADSLHVSVNQLRGVFGSTDAWDRSLAELVADDPEQAAETVAA